MPWNCFIVDDPDNFRKTILPGAMWKLDVAERQEEEWVVRLPGGGSFRLNTKSSTDGKRWDVSGQPPNITISPSINFRSGHKNGWHGWIQNGVLTDDYEGRRYSDIY